MESAINLLVCALLGYLLGSISFAVIVSRLFRLDDPRSFGSGNPGATNVLRGGSKAAALLTLLGDAAKGWIAMAVASGVGAGDTAIALAGLAAFLGHVYPFTLRFRGGKGVATALGVLLGFSATLAGITAAIWLAVAAVSRYSSLAALTAAAAAPFLAWRVVGRTEATVAVTTMCLVLAWRHRGNIRKLLAGSESRIGARRGDPGASV